MMLFAIASNASSIEESCSIEGKAVEISLRDICLEIGRHYKICFVEIGMEEDHIH